MGKNKKKSSPPTADPPASAPALAAPEIRDEPEMNGHAQEPEGNGVEETGDDSPGTAGNEQQDQEEASVSQEANPPVESVTHTANNSENTDASNTHADSSVASNPDAATDAGADADADADADPDVDADPDADADDSASDAGSESTVTRLENDLERTRAEKDQLATQYRSLLSKLTSMRQSLGDRLREDAEELDRRESQIAQLTSDLTRAREECAGVRAELENSAAECTQLGGQVSALRQAATTQSSDVLALTRELRELRGELEMVRVEREEWEAEAGRERERREAMEEELRSGERQRRDDEVRRKRAEEVAERERTRADNLQDVLAEFQGAKDLEIQQATWELEKQLGKAVQELAEWKTRAADAEVKMTNISSDASKTSVLEREIKEKNAQIGRLRHEAVLTQEHLTEALRRLRRNTSDTNVDRRLVTNVLLQFIATPRADPKRFEMLSLLATILSWEDSERERAGLQRAGGGAAAPRKGSTKGKEPDAGKTRTQEEQDTFNESFSDLFVEFLLKEAAQGQKKPSTSPGHTSPQLGGATSPSTNAHPSAALFGRQRTYSSASISSNVSGSYPTRPAFTPTASHGGGAAGDAHHHHNHLNLNLSGTRSPPYMNSLGQRMQASPGAGVERVMSPGMSPRAPWS